MTDRLYQSLRWRCRRGTKELDRQLMRYLDQAYECMSTKEHDAFSRLLTMDDPLLADWLSGVQNTEDAEFVPLINAIRAANSDSD